jgi:hypothetical protein
VHDLRGADRVTPQAPAPDDRQAELEVLRSRMGSYDHVPFVLIDGQKQRELALDPRAGFLLSLMDGLLTVQEIIDVSAMSERDGLVVLYDLMSRSAVALR